MSTSEAKEEMEAPQRIWLSVHYPCLYRLDRSSTEDIEYIRADACAALAAAAKANFAWHIAEEKSLGSFTARLELCNYSQWLTRKALDQVGEYSGVPRLLLDPGSLSAEIVRATVEECETLIRDAVALAILKEKQ